MRPRISIRGPVRPSVRPSVLPSVCPPVRPSVCPSVRPSSVRKFESMVFIADIGATYAAYIRPSSSVTFFFIADQCGSLDISSGRYSSNRKIGSTHTQNCNFLRSLPLKRSNQISKKMSAFLASFAYLSRLISPVERGKAYSISVITLSLYILCLLGQNRSIAWSKNSFLSRFLRTNMRVYV